MYDKNTLDTLGKCMGTILYVYDGSSKRLAYYGGPEEKETDAPAWIISMTESGVVRKLFQKDGKTYAYYCFGAGEEKYLIFRDNQEGTKLGLMIKTLVGTEQKESQKQEDKENANIKKEFIKIKAEHARLSVEIRQKDSVITDLKNKLASSPTVDTEAMRKTIEELKEANASQLSQIRRMKADTDHMNFQKLKQVNAELREEISGITYKISEAEERSGKIRKILQNTVTELTRLLEAAQINRNDLQNIVSKIPAAELRESSSSLTGAKADIKPQPAAPKTRQPDVTDIINAINAAISKNDVSNIDIDKMASVISIKDKEGIKRNPAGALKPIIGTLIGMSKTARLSPRQISILCDALGIRQ